MDPTNSPVTNKDIWGSTAVFAIIGFLLLLPLLFLYPDADFMQSPRAVIAASGIFWGILSVVAFRAFWDLYYQHFYPSWVLPLAPLNIFTYAVFGLVMCFLATRFNTLPVLVFILLGGTPPAPASTASVPDDIDSETADKLRMLRRLNPHRSEAELLRIIAAKDADQAKPPEEEKAKKRWFTRR